jgi:biotin transport system substrate-specific component
VAKPQTNTQSNQVKPLADTQSHSRSIAFTALSIAIIAVSAWITIPLGPVPFTLQMFSITFALLVLTPKQAMCAIAGYLALGAIGVPVFSGMRGGIGVLMGPTGGFLWGYLIGVPVAAGVLALFRKRGVDNVALGVACGLLFTIIAYTCGWSQYMFVANVGPLQSFLVTVAPFIVADIVKVVAATAVARAVIRAVPTPQSH